MVVSGRGGSHGGGEWSWGVMVGHTVVVSGRVVSLWVTGWWSVVMSDRGVSW